MSVLEIVLLCFGILTFIAVVAHAVGFDQKIITSQIVPLPMEEKADHYYYLPQAQLKLTVTATIMLQKRVDDKSIEAKKLLSLKFAPVVDITPDPRAVVKVAYNDNSFSNDDLQLVSSSSGLLQNVKSVTEDRISNIVAQITQASDQREMSFIEEVQISKRPALDTETVVVEITQVFNINNEELENGEIKREWRIPVEGLHDTDQNIVDASFRLITSCKLTQKDLSNVDSFNGLFTRPLVPQQWTLDNRNAQPASFVCLVPDTRSLIKVPLYRVRFVKHQQLPKFQNGLLIENAISKPSQAEGMISVPVNILKAILSIPAQLFQFKLTRVKEDTEYLKALKELQQAKDDLKESSHQLQVKQLLEKIEKEKKIQKVFPATAAQPKIPQLGKLPPKEPPAADLKDEMDFIKVMEEAATESITPPAYDWSAGYNEWNNYNNDKYKTCVPAAAAHLRISWTHNSNKPVKAASVQTVMDTLRLVAPSQDITKGCYMSDFMSHWRSKGMDGVKIARYIPIKKQHTNLLKQAVYWFGGCLIGLQLPQSAIGKTVWNYPSEEPEKDNIEWGGHTVCVLGYSGSGFTVISWGQRIVMSHEFYRQYNDESYVALSRVDWTTEKDESPTSEKQSYSQLNKLMNKIYTV